MTRFLSPAGALLAAMMVMTTFAWAAVPEAATPIAALDDGLIQSMKTGKGAPFADRYNKLLPIVQRAFDLDAILQTSVGPRWASFTPAQQSELRAEFVRFTVSSYVSNFSSFGGEKFEIAPDQRAIGADEVVSTKIVPTSGNPARLDYVMRQGSGGWRAVDVLLDGTISRVAVQRSDFRSMLASGGPDALVASLKKKVADLSGGAAVP